MSPRVELSVIVPAYQEGARIRENLERLLAELDGLGMAQHLGFRRIVEAPIELTFRFASSVRLSSAFRVLWDIFYRLHTLRYCDRAVLPSPADVDALEASDA